jgi:thiamine-phosphate pyrophosphorylase
MKPLAQCRLYTFIDTAWLGARQASAVARQLCDGGSDLIQLRAKGATTDEVCRLAEEILPVLHRAGVGLVINDHWEIACKIGADLCHLGQEDFFGAGWTDSSQLLPAGKRLRLRLRLGLGGDGAHIPLLGLSTNAPTQALRALAARPAYIAIGPVYPTPTKPGVAPVTLDYVRWAAANIPIPWFAIGGINLGNISEVLQAGATRICAVSAILNAPDPAEACRQFGRHLTNVA